MTAAAATVSPLGRTRILCGDATARLRELPDESAHACVTSPPYWSLRHYGVAGQIGLEATPAEWCAALVAVFREVRRVLRRDGTLWVVIGDAYAGSWGADSRGAVGRNGLMRGRKSAKQPSIAAAARAGCAKTPHQCGVKRKDLVGLPWMLAFALRDDGWYLRADVVWSKPNGRPESCRDRPTKSHDYVFLLSRSARYRYHRGAVATPYSPRTRSQMSTTYAGRPRKAYGDAGVQDASDLKRRIVRGMLRNGGANLRSVWSIPTQPFFGEHHATYPQGLVERCLAAATVAGDVVLDPFLGAGTTAMVANGMGRDCVGVELSAEYCRMAERRMRGAFGAFARVEVG